jgi:pilus assembly protein CpaB
VVVAAPPPPPLTDKALVAAKALNSGDVIDESGMRWQDLQDKIPEGAIRKSASPSHVEKDLKGKIVRSKVDAGRPLLWEYLDRSTLESDLKEGKRAVAINIDAQGSSTAGGFILPNNRVDVIHTFRDEGAARKGNGNAYVSQTILTNIPVLAIGQNYQVRNGDRVVTGANATLELTPAQAETIILAQRTGLLSLALRGVKDVNAAGEEHLKRIGLMVVRNGVATQDMTR